jgi:hypothetical protein
VRQPPATAGSRAAQAPSPIPPPSPLRPPPPPLPHPPLSFLKLNFEPVVHRLCPVWRMGEKVGCTWELAQQLTSLRSGAGMSFDAMSKRMRELQLEK